MPASYFVSNLEKLYLSVWFPRWQQFSWSVIVPTAVQSMSGGWHAAEGAQSSNSASSMVPRKSPQAGVQGPVPSTHNALAVWWPSTHDTDGPSFEYLVRALRYVSVFLLQCCFALKRIPVVMRSFNVTHDFSKRSVNPIFTPVSFVWVTFYWQFCQMVAIQ